MSDRSHEPEHLLESLLSDEEQEQEASNGAAAPIVHEDLDALIDDLERMFGQAKRMPFGRKLMVNEGEALAFVDALRAAVPSELRQAQRILEEQQRILGDAHDHARNMLDEHGLMAMLEVERERLITHAEREAERIPGDADAYVQGVLSDLADRLARIQASVQNGLEALQEQG